MKYNDLKILVTGVGGDLAQAIIKCLRIMEMPVYVYGCDVDINSIGSSFVDEFQLVPSAKNKAYLMEIQKICKLNHINAVIPGSEPEIFVLSRAIFRDGFKLCSELICQEYDCLKIFYDKFKCFNALLGKVDLAPFADGRDDVEIQKFIDSDVFPCVVKSRESSGSRDIKLAKNKDELLECLKEIENPIIQQYIGDEHGEFSVGLFVCDDFVASVAFKRKIDRRGGGASWYADNFEQDKSVLNYANKVGRISNLQGSFNIQVRKSSKGVRLLEINPRFSSLAAARSICGFRDVEWSVLAALGYRIAAPKLFFKKIRFQRYLHEVIDFGSGYFGIEKWEPKKCHII